MKRSSIKEAEENIWNVPNTLTFLRVLIAFVTVYLIFSGYDLKVIALFFTVGMITDFLDGQIARRFNQKTEFGRKFDMVADRFLMVSAVLAFIVDLILVGDLTRAYMLQIFLIMSREIIALPVAIIAIASGKIIPHVRFIGKATTFLQAVTFPLILLSIKDPFFDFSIYFALLTCAFGLISGFAYINDVLLTSGKRS